MPRKVNPKFKNMTEEELDEWKEKMRYLEGDNINKDASNQINLGRGWMY